MHYDFKVRTDTVNGSEDELYTVYGIDVIHNSVTVKSVSDVFCERTAAEKFARYCYKRNVLPDEIEDIAADIIDVPEKHFVF